MSVGSWHLLGPSYLTVLPLPIQGTCTYVGTYIEAERMWCMHDMVTSVYLYANTFNIHGYSNLCISTCEDMKPYKDINTQLN